MSSVTCPWSCGTASGTSGNRNTILTFKVQYEWPNEWTFYSTTYMHTSGSTCCCCKDMAGVRSIHCHALRKLKYKYNTNLNKIIHTIHAQTCSRSVRVTDVTIAIHLYPYKYEDNINDLYVIINCGKLVISVAESIWYLHYVTYCLANWHSRHKKMGVNYAPNIFLYDKNVSE